MTVLPSAQYWVRKSGSNTNGGGYDSGISGAGTNYANQNAAQASGTHGACSNNTTFVDSTANAFTSAMVGNSIWISSGGGTVGAYFVTGFTSASTVTIDRAPGTVTNGSWALGGAWADPWTNNANAVAWTVPGIAFNIEGGGTDTPSSADYHYTASGFTPNPGDLTNGCVTWRAFNGRPLIDIDSILFNYPPVNYHRFIGFYFRAATGNSFGSPILNMYDRCTTWNCVFDQNGYDARMHSASGGNVSSCEYFSSVTVRSGTPAQPCLITSGSVSHCIFHDTLAHGAQTDTADLIYFDHCIFANCVGEGCRAEGVGGPSLTDWFTNCTFYNNGGNGGLWLHSNSLELIWYHCMLMNNIFANHSGSGVYCTNISSLTAVQLGKQIARWAGNFFYSNGTDITGLTLTADMTSDNTFGTNPNFVAAGTQNFALSGTSALIAAGIGLPINRKSGTTGTVSNSSPGVWSPAGGSTTLVINQIRNLLVGEDYAS